MTLEQVIAGLNKFWEELKNESSVPPPILICYKDWIWLRDNGML